MQMIRMLLLTFLYYERVAFGCRLFMRLNVQLLFGMCGRLDQT